MKPSQVLRHAAVLLALFLAPAGFAATFTVTNTAVSGAGSLRQAILDANASAGANLIAFNIPGGGVQIITPGSVLPAITNQVMLDATTQPGYVGAPLIVLNGNGTGIDGLIISAPRCAIKGLVLGGFGGFGSSSARLKSAITLLSASNTVTACYIGVSETGSGTRQNVRNGILISNAPGNVIGGLTVADRNLIGVNSTGVFITGTNASNNVVLGNWFSLSRDGSNTLANGTDIIVSNAPNNTIGGTNAAARNVFEKGIVVNGGAVSNAILGNYINLLPDGSPTPTPSGLPGVLVQNAIGTMIGGTTAGARNVISGCDTAVQIMDATTTGTVVQGNYLGTDPTGMTTNFNYTSISISGSSGNLIGGATAGAGNVILGKGIAALSIAEGANDNVVQGNFIGTDASGMNPLHVGNFSLTIGILISSASIPTTGNLIGGTNAGARNVISLTADGVQINLTSNNIVQGNYLGVAADGVKALGNGQNGVQCYGANSNLISGNLIGNNGGAGVYLYFATNNLVSGNTIFSNAATGVTLFGANVISSNSIYGNGGLGIDRGGNGPTANTPNGQSNYPILTSARQGSTIIDGTLNGLPNCTYVIQFYSNPASDSNAQARTFVGSIAEDTDGSGNAPFHVEFTTTTEIGAKITATATGYCPGKDPETSEISPSVTVTASVPAVSAANITVAGTALALKLNDPVSTFTGELYESLPANLDLGGPMRFAFARYYAAFLKQDGLIAGSLGDNWLHNFEMKLTATASNTVNIVNNRGRLIQFTNSGGTFTLIGAPDIPFQLASNAGNYILGDPRSQRLHTFDSTGKLIKIEDGHGNTHTLTYAGSQLASVSDGLGRTFTLEYHPGGLLAGVSDGTRTVGFIQNGNNLVVTTDALGFVTTYSYDAGNANPGLMTAMTLPEGNVPYAQTFDTQGRVVSQTAAGTNTTTLAYTNLITTIIDPLGRTNIHTHTATGEASSLTDETGLTLALGNDASRRRTSVTDRLGRTTRIAYHAPSGKPSAVTNADGTVTSFSYANRAVSGVTFHDLAQVSYPDGTSETFSYDANGNVLTRTDRAGKVFTFTYNARGQALTAQNPLGGIATFTYNADGTLATRTDTDTGATQFFYDAVKRLTNLVHPDSTAMRAVFDANDRVVSVTDERGNTATFTYDMNNRPTQAVDANGKTNLLAYDNFNRVMRATDRLGRSSGAGFDALNRVASVTNRNGHVSSLAYDARQRLTSFTDPGGRTWGFGYDDEAVPVSSTNPLAQASSRRLDALGYAVASTNALGQVVTLARDALRRVTGVVDAIARTNQFSYEPRGGLASATAPLIGTATYQRNNLGQLSGITDLNGRQWSFSYTAMGRLQSLTDPLNRSSALDYDTRGRRRKTTFADGTTRTNSYDSASNLARAQHSSGPDLPYSYDSLNRLVTADNLAFSYDAEGRVTNTASSSINFGASYDAGGRLTNVTYLNGALTIRYTYDSRDRLTRVQDSLTGAQMDFSYDDAGRLTGLTRANGVNGTYTYDAAGRLTRLQEGGIIDLQYTLNAAAEVTAANFTAPLDPGGFTNPIVANFAYDAAHQVKGAGFAYDPRGRQTTAPGHGFAWDGASRLIGIDGVTLGYNGVNDIVTRAQGGVTTRYFYNHALGLHPIVAEKNETTGLVLRYYVWTPGGRLLYLIHAQNGNAVSYFHFDRVGSTLALTAANGSMTDAYAYSPYGALLGRTGTSAQPFTYIGAFGVRAEGALYQMRARYYEPLSARFLSLDPRGPRLANSRTLDPYAYATENPIAFIDPQGTDEISVLDRVIHFLGLGTTPPGRVETAQEKASRARDYEFEEFRARRQADDAEFDRRKRSSRVEEGHQDGHRSPSTWADGYEEGSKYAEDKATREYMDELNRFYHDEYIRYHPEAAKAEANAYDAFKAHFNHPKDSGALDAGNTMTVNLSGVLPLSGSVHSGHSYFVGQALQLTGVNPNKDDTAPSDQQVFTSPEGRVFKYELRGGSEDWIGR